MSFDVTQQREGNTEKQTPIVAWRPSRLDAGARHKPPHPVARIAQLQQSIGNQRVSRMLQKKLVVGPAGDEYEREADRVAEAVTSESAQPSSAHTFLRAPRQAAPLQRRCSCGGTCSSCEEEEEEKVQRKEAASAVSSQAVSDAPPIVDEVLRSPGQPLDPATRAYFEPRFGYDFGGVRVHSDSRAAESARSVNALAYTVGNNLVFGSGQYATPSKPGQRLLAHELSHVVQQGSALTAIVERKIHTSSLPCVSPRVQRQRLVVRGPGLSEDDTSRAAQRAIDEVEVEGNRLLRDPKTLRSGFLLLQQAAHTKLALKHYRESISPFSIRIPIATGQVQSGGANPASAAIAFTAFVAAAIVLTLTARTGDNRTLAEELARELTKLTKGKVHIPDIPLEDIKPKVEPTPDTATEPETKSKPGGTVDPIPPTVDPIPPEPEDSFCSQPLPIKWPVHFLPLPRGEDAFPLHLIRSQGRNVTSEEASGTEAGDSVQRDFARKNIIVRGDKGMNFPFPRSESVICLSPANRAAVFEAKEIPSEKGFHAHHIKPLYLGGLDAESNLCVLARIPHQRGHTLLDDQSNMLSNPTWIKCKVTEPRLSRHPFGRHYIIVGVK